MILHLQKGEKQSTLQTALFQNNFTLDTSVWTSKYKTRFTSQKQYYKVSIKSYLLYKCKRDSDQSIF